MATARKKKRTTSQDVNFCGILIPKGTPFPHQGKATAPPKTESGGVFVSLAEVLNWFMKDPKCTSIVQPYHANRGVVSDSKFGFNPNTTKSCEEDGYNRDHNGKLGVAMYDGVLTMTGWHSRGRGFIQRFLNGKMTKRDLESKVPVVYHADFLSAYVGEGAKGISHTSKMQTCNPDFAYGHCLEHLKTILGNVSSEKMLHTRFSTSLKAIFYTMHKETEGEDQDWTDWARIYTQRGAAGKNFDDELAGVLNITDEQYEKLASAVEFWYSLANELDKHSKIKAIRAICRSGGFFGYVVVDQYGKRNQLFKTHSTTVRNIVAAVSEVEATVPYLQRGKHYEIRNGVTSLDKIVRRRK